jgi:hypothetical protein
VGRFRGGDAPIVLVVVVVVLVLENLMMLPRF